jgi:hypothetical protein
MFRFAAIAALALQLLSCVAPANAFILCISDDGCVELELAAPGTARCPEQSCDSEHAGDDHGCADIPVLHDAFGPLRGAQLDAPIAFAALTALPDLVWLAAAPPIAAAADPQPPADLVPRRTIVLQL